MEIGELITVVAFGKENWECPLPHDTDKYEDFPNEFTGSGSTLGDRMNSAKSTSNNPSLGCTPEKDVDPGQTPGHALSKLPSEPLEHRLPVNLLSPYGGVKPWPVTCAAHHLIPAQASLRDSALLPWLIKQGKPDKVKSTTSEWTVDGYLLASVGYDVNGAENGVWLPGPYAMQGIWSEFLAFPDEENENPVGNVPGNTATAAPMEEQSSQFDYAVVAMKKARAQFHDAHPDYSKVVKEALDLISAKMVASTAPKFCDKCPERKSTDPLPPSYRLVTKLNHVSARLRVGVTGSPLSWHPSLYTSKKALEFLKYPSHAPQYNP